MVNSNVSPVGARKEDYEECTRHIDELIKSADVLEIARHVGLNINEDVRISCPANLVDLGIPRREGARGITQ